MKGAKLPKVVGGYAGDDQAISGEGEGADAEAKVGLGDGETRNGLNFYGMPPSPTTRAFATRRTDRR